MSTQPEMCTGEIRAGEVRIYQPRPGEGAAFEVGTDKLYAAHVDIRAHLTPNHDAQPWQTDSLDCDHSK